MNRLSTNGSKKKSTPIDRIQDDIEQIPDYLTKRNPSFQQMLHQALSTTTLLTIGKNDNTHLESLRHIAILIYKTMIIRAHHVLWTTHLKSGTGQLITTSQVKLSYSVTVSIWPKQVKILSQTVNGKHINHEHEFYLELVHNHLYKLKQQLKQVQTELNLKASSFQGYTSAIQKIIEAYIEQNLQPFRMNILHQIELIHYDYHIRSLKLEYLQQKPNAYQVDFVHVILCVIGLL